MIIGRPRIKFISIFFIFLLLILSSIFCPAPAAEHNSRASTTASEQNLGLLYLSKYYLIPGKPGDDPSNKTELPAADQTIFGHSIHDRKLDTAILPELDLWVNDGGRKGMELEFEIQVQAVEDKTVIPEKKYKMLFKNYTTQGRAETYQIKIEFINYLGKTFDVKYGKEDWVNIALVIKRLDNETGNKLLIYHGADGKASFIQLPWNQTLSKYEYEKDKNDNDSPGFGFQIVVVSFIAIIFSIYIATKKRNHNKKKRS